MHSQEHGPEDRPEDCDGTRSAQRPPEPRQDSGVRYDPGLAQEAHTLISLFLDIEDAAIRQRCIEFVRRHSKSG